MSNIRAVFPKHIYHLDNVCIDHLDMFRKRILEIQSESGVKSNKLLNVKSTHLTNMMLHTDPVFAPLVNQINESAMEFGTYLGYLPETIFRLHIGNMWANTSGKGGYNFPHTHSGSILSGAFYINAIPENKIIFFDDYINTEMPTNVDVDTFDHVTYDCTPGRLVMFKSDLAHGNPPQQDDGEKIVISFNIGRG